MKKALIVYILIGLLVAVGWVKNIIAILHFGAFATWGGMEVARIIGVFIPPLGGILGWF